VVRPLVVVNGRIIQQAHYFIIYYNGGNVGIGRTNPIVVFDVNHDIRISASGSVLYLSL
jgi:hypothetical protein